MTDDASRQQQRSWRSLKVAVTLMSGIAILGGTNTLAEAALQCSVGGSKQTHATIQAAVDDPACTKVRVASGEWEPFTVTCSVQVRGAQGAIVRPAATVTNRYDRNKCKNNDGGVSAPDGLCQ